MRVNFIKSCRAYISLKGKKFSTRYQFTNSNWVQIISPLCTIFVRILPTLKICNFIHVGVMRLKFIKSCRASISLQGKKISTRYQCTNSNWVQIISPLCKIFVRILPTLKICDFLHMGVMRVNFIKSCRAYISLKAKNIQPATSSRIQTGSR